MDGDSDYSQLIGWYSAQGAALDGTFIYAKDDGEEVEVSAVYSVKENGKINYRCPDKVCLGPVSHFLRRGRLGLQKSSPR